METTSPPSHLTVAETAQVLRCSTKTVLRCVTSGRLPASRPAGKYLIPRAAIDELLRPESHHGS